MIKILRNKVIESNIVGIGKNDDEKLALRDALSYLPLQNLVKNTDCVTITANFVNANPANKGVIVGQETLRELIRFFKEKNPSRIVIAGGSGGANTGKVLDSFGHKKVIEEEGVEFIDVNSGEFTEIKLDNNIVPSTKINKLINETNVLVSFTQLKHHEEATMSSSIKNIALSWPPAEVHGYPKTKLGIHKDLHSFIYSMASVIPIDLSIVSMSPVMIGTGPSKGKPVHTGLIAAGLDAVAVDTICARLLGFRPQAINYLYRLINSGVGQGNIESIDLKGMKLVELEKYFSKTVYGQEFAIDE